MKKILVLGGTGFIGSNFIDAVKDEYDVTYLDRMAESENLPSNFIWSDILSLSQESELYSRLNEFHAVVDFASIARVQPSFQDPTKYILNNVSCVTKVLDLLHKVNYKGKYIYTSSSSVYGATLSTLSRPSKETDDLLPDSPYGLSKKLAEDVVAHYAKFVKFDCIITRPFSVYGDKYLPEEHGYQTLIQRLFDAKEKQITPTIVNDGGAYRDFTHVSDLIGFYKLLIDTNNISGIFNIGSGNPVMISEIFDLFKFNEVKKVYDVKEPPVTWADLSRVNYYFPEFVIKNDIRQWLRNKLT